MVLAGILSVVGIMMSMTLPVPYVIVSPGPVFNTLGEYRGEQIVQISGTQTYPTDGEINMTTVSERGGPYGPLTVGEAVVAVFNSTMAVIPRELLFPPDLDNEQSKQRSAADFDEAQSNATAAALGKLDIPVVTHPMVTSVVTDGPAQDVLEPGDIVLSVAGTPVTAAAEVVVAVQAKQPGETLPMVVSRDGEEVPVEVPVGANPTTPERSYLGVTLQPHYEAPFDLEFTLEGVGGPSAGLVFSLAILDELQPESLTGGDVIAGTGTIDPDSKVGPIGGIGQKMVAAKDAGAVLFLAPRANCDTVRTSTPDGLPVAAVDTLDEALTALADHRAGRPPRGCDTAA
jgi:Lon-like protease